MSRLTTLAALHLVARTLKANPLRTVLSTLGIVIGVAALVAVLSIGEGAERFSRQMIERATDLHIVMVTTRTTERIGGVLVRREDYPVLTPEDRADMADRVAGLAHLTLLLSEPARLTLVDDTTQRAAVINAVEPGARAFFEPGFAAGRFFTAEEAVGNDPVIVLSHELASQFAGDGQVAPLLGRSVRIGESVRRVVGVLGEEEGDTRPNAYVPLQAERELFQAQAAPRAPTLLLKAVRLEEIDDVRSQAETWLAERFGSWEADFRIEVAARRVEQAQQVMLTFKLIMAAIVGISILVGGIGIMNILLASAYERTREIGIRKAAGARNRDILLQFLAESITISAVGSAIGVVVGLVGAFGVTKVIRAISEAPLEMAFSWEIVVAAAAVAVGVGVIFGTYPARRAAQMEPVEAIRYE
jgi:putative ABC transport system permease protein